MLTRLLRAEVIFIAALGVASLAFAIAGRAFFPWPLEWMEGATLDHAVRLLEGRAIYAPPSAQFVPYLYPPLSYLPMSASVAIFGATLPAARLPSILATAATLFFLGRAASRAGAGTIGGIFAAGLWALGYGYGGAFHDLARVDAFFLLLVAAGTERLQSDRPRTALALFALSFFAKQHGLLFLVAASAWLAWKDFRRHLPGLVGTWGGVAFLFFAIDLDSGGWFVRYCFSVPRAHGVIWRFLPAYLVVGVLLPLPLLAAAAGLAFARRLRDPRPVDALLPAGLAASALGRAHIGGYDNVLLPGYAILVVVASSAIVPRLLGPEAAQTRPLMRALVGVALAIQAALLFQPPTAHWPLPESRTRFRALARALRTCADGAPAVALDHARLGGRPFLHTMALSDLRAADGWIGRAATRGLLRGLHGRRAPAAIAVGARFEALDEALARGYRLCDAVRAPPLATGYQPPDQTIYVRAP